MAVVKRGEDRAVSMRGNPFYRFLCHSGVPLVCSKKKETTKDLESLAVGLNPWANLCC